MMMHYRHEDFSLGGFIWFPAVPIFDLEGILTGWHGCLVMVLEFML